ncbi:MAG: serine/threonine-protein kinase [Actinomycetota bacterium]
MRPGDTIGPHRLVRTLGAGAFATVWLAVDELLDAEVAIKVLADNWARDDDVRRRFVDEARILRRIDHDRIVRVFSVEDPPDGQPMFVMSYADRGSLEGLLDQHRAGGTTPGEATAAAVVLELLAGLRVVHDFGVIHRDLKPSNVLFRSYRPYEQAPESDHPLAATPGAMVLADFGLAKDTIARSGFTAAAGTPAYMAPEQARTTSQLDERADVYAATAILFELLTGAAPFSASTLHDVRGHRAEAPDLAVHERGAALRRRDRWQAVIDRGMALDPAARFATASALAAAIVEVGAVEEDRASLRSSNIETVPLSPLRQRTADLLRRFDAEYSTDIDRRLAEPMRVTLAGDLPGRDALVAAIADRPVEVIEVAPGDVRIESCDVVVHRADAPVAIDGRFGPVWSEAVAVDARGDAPLDRSVNRPVEPLDEQFGARSGESPGDRFSGVRHDVEAFVSLIDLLVGSGDLVAVSAALDRLDDDVRLAGSAAMSAAWMEVADDVEQLRLDIPQLADPPAARSIVAGRVALPPDRKTQGLRILLGADLGGEDDVARLLDDWRRFHSSGEVAFTARTVAAAVVRALERRWLAARAL